MALTKEEINEIIKGLSKADKSQREALATALGVDGDKKKSGGKVGKIDIDNLDEFLAGKERLLEIEMEIAKSWSSTQDQMRLANEALEILRASEEGAFERGSQKAQEMAAKLGMTVEEMHKMAELYEELGENGRAAYDSMKGSAEKFGSKIKLVSKESENFFKGIQKIGLLANSPEGIKGMTMAIKDTFTPTKIAANLLYTIGQATMEAFTATDKAAASFAKATGSGRMYTKSISQTALAHSNLGINIEQSGKAHQALHTTMANFDTVSSKTRDDLVVLTAAFDKFGLGMDTAGQMVEEFNKAFGTSTEEAVDMTRKLALSAKGLNMNMSDFVKGFQSANKVLAVYGTKSVKIFSNVAAAARAAGVEASSLLDLAGKFDTFSDAAEHTGKLNAILGTQMSAMDMLTMKEDKRIEYLLRNIQASGKQFKNMDRFTQKAIANAAGITDMAEANKIFGMSFKEYKANQRKMAAQDKSQKEMNDRMQKAMSIGEQLKTIFMNFAISMEFMVPIIKDFAEGLSNFMQSFHDMNGPLFAFIAGFLVLLPVLYPVFAMFKSIAAARALVAHRTKMQDLAQKQLDATTKLSNKTNQTKLTLEKKNSLSQQKKITQDRTEAATIKQKDIAQKSSNVTQKTTNRLNKMGWKAMLAMGGAIALAGAGLMMAAKGMAEFVKAFKGMGITEILGASAGIIILAGSLYFLVPAILTAAKAAGLSSGPLMALGVAIMFMGAGMGIAAAGMGELVKGFAGLSGPQIWGAIGAILILTVAMGGFLVLMGKGLASGILPTSAGLMLALGAAFLMLGAGVALAGWGMSKFVEAFSSLSVSQVIGLNVSLLILGAALYFLATATGMMGIVAKMASGPLLALGGAFLLMGGGVAVAALGMSVLVESFGLMVGNFTELAKHGFAAVGVLFGMAGAVVALAYAMGLLANPLTLIGMVMLLGVLYNMSQFAQAQAKMASETSNMVAQMTTLSEDLKTSLENFVEIKPGNFFLAFLEMYTGIKRVMSALDLKGEAGIKVHHSLENLALIATGTSARTLGGDGGSGIVSAINNLGNKMNNQQTIRVEVDEVALKKILRDGYFEIRGET